ncbi:MAG: Abi family protein [Corynebacterium flavescens]|nr:Abi family protein [Corynebacterium flavescens]
MTSNNRSERIHDLEAWFSPARRSTYNYHPDPEALYLWNTQITKAFLEDIQHVEVLLRNRVDVAVSPKYGARWYTNPRIPFDQQAKNSIKKAERRARGSTGQVPPPGRVIAELNFDFWAYLFTNTYTSTIWPPFRKTLHGTPLDVTEKNKNRVSLPSLVDFKREVNVVYRLRNRCAHHEPIVKKSRHSEESHLDEAQQAIAQLATWIDPAAAQWIITRSRISDLRNNRP